ncbi:MAG: helix-turn-helix domain-containing protein [Thermoanaerobaculia bacterium]
MSGEASAPTLGSLLRSLRRRNGWTLKQMGERTGIPLSTLSKVEHDRLTLTYDRLQLLSQRLDISMSELFAEPQERSEPAVTARRSLGSEEDALRVETPNYDYYYLCPELRQKRMIPVLVRLLARSLEEFGELVRHAGEEYTYVLRGRVVLHTEFYEPLLLEEGGCVYIDSTMGHAYLAAEDEEEDPLVLSVCSSGDNPLMESLLELQREQGTLARITRPKKAATRR